MAESKAKSLEFAGLKCLKCGYRLEGLSRQVCPECGTGFDLALLRKAERRRRRRWVLMCAAIIVLAYYGPYAWLVSMDYPWSGYRWTWVRMWPGLPLLLIYSLTGLRRLTEPIGLDADTVWGAILLSIPSIALLCGLIRLSKRGKLWLIIVATIVLALSAVNSWILYGLFRM